MSGSVSTDDLVAWIRAFHEAVQQQKDELTRLDSEIGDADHGSNMARGLDAVVAKLDPVPANPADLFKTVGMTLVSTVGGASGPLYGTFFLRMGPALAAGGQIDADALGAALRAGVDGVVARDVDALLALTGIGDYTARAVAVFAYGDRHPVVDTNTRRVLARAVEGVAQPGPPHRRDLQRMDAELPHDMIDAAIVNAAAMELGAIVCTARSPKCDLCPLAAQCAWRAAGYPAFEDRRRRQAKYEGSDRQARGAVLKVLREAAPSSVPLFAVLPDWSDTAQRDRAIDSLIADGLAEAVDDVLRLPGHSAS